MTWKLKIIFTFLSGWKITIMILFCDTWNSDFSVHKQIVIGTEPCSFVKYFPWLVLSYHGRVCTTVVSMKPGYFLSHSFQTKKCVYPHLKLFQYQHIVVAFDSILLLFSVLVFINIQTLFHILFHFQIVCFPNIGLLKSVRKKLDE